MCQAKADGGHRCEYADALSLVRRKAQYKYRDESDYKRIIEAEKAVKRFQRENPALVRAHLPERQTFQVPSSKKKIPAEYQQMFARERNAAITGLQKEEREALTRELYEERQEWEALLPPTGTAVMGWYAMAGFECVNPYLRRRGFSQWAKKNPGLFHPEGLEHYIENTIKPNISQMDAIFAAAQKKRDAPRKVFRFFEVPAGVTPSEYLNRYFHAGESIVEKGYMSTSVDPEFIMMAVHEKNGGKRNKQFVVMEIVTKKGLSLQPTSVSRSGNIQSLEKEVVLPRNSKFRIAGVKKTQRFEFASDRPDLSAHLHHYDRGKFPKGARMNLPVIQLVDEDLLEK